MCRVCSVCVDMLRACMYMHVLCGWGLGALIGALLVGVVYCTSEHSLVRSTDIVRVSPRDRACCPLSMRLQQAPCASGVAVLFEDGLEDSGG